MLFDRIYLPKDDEIIYHYCNAFTFQAICENRTLRFSDIFSMNDFLEMHWGYHIWERAASELLDTIGKDFLDEIDKIINSSGIRGLPLTTCFSLSGDVLSQWRAYADDGNGYAIGFLAKDIFKLPIRPLKVLYDEKEQVKEMVNVIKAIFDVESSAKKKFSNNFVNSCYELAFDLSSLKNPAFSEEQEIRMIHLTTFQKSNNFLKLVDDGGTAFGKPIKGQPIKFRIANNTPVAYIDFDFSNNLKVNPIKEVVIGPKNDVLPTAISVYLESIGIGGVKILRSRASYR